MKKDRSTTASEPETPDPVTAAALQDLADVATLRAGQEADRLRGTVEPFRAALEAARATWEAERPLIEAHQKRAAPVLAGARTLPATPLAGELARWIGEVDRSGTLAAGGEACTRMDRFFGAADTASPGLEANHIHFLFTHARWNAAYYAQAFEKLCAVVAEIKTYLSRQAGTPSGPSIVGPRDPFAPPDPIPHDAVIRFDVFRQIGKET